jgi:hypothetical protein
VPLTNFDRLCRSKAYEQKNIRRRVYDAINVLLAMNIIVKDRKDIRWVGFPVNALFECELIDVTQTNVRVRLANDRRLFRRKS